jgi:hypothetical protein
MRLMHRAFSTKGGDKGRDWLIDEMLKEDPKRQELLSLERIEFFFTKLYHATGKVHLEEFQDQLCALLDRECWVQHFRDVFSQQQEVH